MHLAAVARVIVVHYVQRRQARFGQSSVHPLALGSNHLLVREVHVHDTLVALNDPVLQPRVDAQIVLAREHERGLLLQWNVDAVILHEALQSSDDDRAGPAETSLGRDVGVVLEREAPLGELVFILDAMLVELEAQGAKQARAAVVAALGGARSQRIQALEHGRIARPGLDGHAGAEDLLIGRQRNLGEEVLNRDRDALAEVPVAGVAEEADPGVGAIRDVILRVGTYVADRHREPASRRAFRYGRTPTEMPVGANAEK